MKHPIPALLVALLLALALGCQSKAGTGALVGGGAGALAGGLIGGRTGTLVGTLLGAAVGAGVGYGLDQQDREQAADVLETTPSNQTREWVNPDTGARYRMTPVETFAGEQGQPCREFTMRGFVDGESEEVFGTACRQPDGTWRIVESAPV